MGHRIRGSQPFVPAGQTSSQALGANAIAYAVAPPTITIGGVQATVIADALNPSALGLYQIAVTVPSTVSTGDQQIVATVGGKNSPAGISIPVQ